MAKTLIQDDMEVRRWFEQGWTYRRMQEEYLRKYDIETSISMWSNYRQRNGLHRRIERNDDMLPWAVRKVHRHRNQANMLRAAHRAAQNLPIGPTIRRAYESWIRSMRAQDCVVHYDPDTEQGFFYVARRPNIDKGLIREPEKKTTSRRNAER